MPEPTRKPLASRSGATRTTDRVRLRDSPCPYVNGPCSHAYHQGRVPTFLSGRVGMWRGSSRFGLSVAAPFVWRCPSNLAVAPFPHPSHRTGHADLPHPALGQDLTPMSTTGRAPAQ